MSKMTSDNVKKSKLKANVGEFMELVLKDLKLMNDPDTFIGLTVDKIFALLAMTKKHLEDKENLETELFVQLENMKRLINYWNENKGENNEWTTSNEEESHQHISSETIERAEWKLAWRNLWINLRGLFDKLGIDMYSSEFPQKVKVSQSSASASIQEDNGPTKFDEFMNKFMSKQVEVVKPSHSRPVEYGNIFSMYMDSLTNEKQFFLKSLVIFPENVELKKRLLVHWWIGLDVSSKIDLGNETAEKQAEDCFSEFVEHGVLKPVHVRKHNKVVDRYTIEPIVHRELASFYDFLKSVNAKDGGTWQFWLYNENFEQKMAVPMRPAALLNLDIRYLNSRDVIDNMKKREPMVIQLGRWHHPMSVDNENLSDHIDVDETDFLKEMGKHTVGRYISLQGISGISELPKSIATVECLKVLDLRSCHNLEKLPQKSWSKLRKMIAWALPQKWFKELTHLDLSECHLLDQLPKWVSELSNLEVLKGFVVGSMRSKKSQLCQLHDLAKLKKLKKLSIKVCDQHFNVANFSFLEPLNKLSALTIIWSIDYQNATANEAKQFEPEKTSRDKAKDSLNIPGDGCEQAQRVKGDNVVETEKQSRVDARQSFEITQIEGEHKRGIDETRTEVQEKKNIESAQDNSIMSRAKSKQASGTEDKVEKKPGKKKMLDNLRISLPRERQRTNKERTIYFPQDLEKLDIRNYPNAEAPELLNTANLQSLKRLYIRGGKLKKIRQDAGWEVEILRFRYLQMFIFDWYDLSATFPKLRCVEYEDCPRLRNFPRYRSLWVEEQDGSLSGQFNDDEEVNSELPGGRPDVHELIRLRGKFTKVRRELKADLCLQEDKIKTVVELEATNRVTYVYASDLVVILDISRMMEGDKLEEIKSSVLFLAGRLNPRDRLSIVTFNTMAKRLCGLCKVTESFKEELKYLISSLEAEGDSNSIIDGLQLGLKVLSDRRFNSNHNIKMILIAGGTQTIRSGEAAQLSLGNVPLHTFVLGENHDSMVLKDSTEKNIRRSFYHIDNLKNLSLALSERLDLILRPVIRDLKLVTVEEGQQITVVFGDLHPEETRKATMESVLHFDLIESDEANLLCDVSYEFRGQQYEEYGMLVWMDFS